MQRFSKIARVCLTACLFSFCFLGYSVSDVFASTFSISSNTNSVAAQGQFTVTVTISGSGMIYFSGSNASVSAGSMYCDSSCSVTATAGSSGAASVTATAGEAGTQNEVTDYSDGSNITGSRTVNVSIQSQNNGGNSNNGGNQGGGNSGSNQSGSTAGGGVSNPNAGNSDQSSNSNNENDGRSSDNTLKSLGVSMGTLSPEFNPETIEYSVALSATADKITVEAASNDDKASIEGIGEHTLNSGSNAIHVVVTAENGNSRTYTINIELEEAPDTFIDYNGQKLGVVKVTDGLSIPAGFEETTITLSGQEVKAWINKTANITLVYMMNEKNEKNFYIYNNNVITSIYIPITLFDRQYAVIDVPEELQTRYGMTFAEVEVDGNKMPGWTFDDTAFSDFVLVYLMDDQGKITYYQYDKKMNTLQRYSGAAAITQEAYEQMLEDHNSTITMQWIIIGVLIVLNIAALGVLIYMLMKKKKQRPMLTVKEASYQDDIYGNEDTDLDDFNHHTEQMNINREDYDELMDEDDDPQEYR